VGDILQCELEETTSFPLKHLMTWPLFIVSTGTGVAPMRSVLQARFMKGNNFDFSDNVFFFRLRVFLVIAIAEEINEKNTISFLKSWNQILCFFGYRHPKKDFLFHDDWHAMSSSMVSLPNHTLYPSLNPLKCLNISTIIAFSQENQKVYVQDALMHFSSKVCYLKRFYK
jgi:sulfite reductase alpha subunit-like flavoprotein